MLGPLEVRSSSDKPVDIGGQRQRRLLAALLLGHGSPVSSADLVEAVWPESERPLGADSALRTYVSRLRRAMSFAELGTSGALSRIGSSDENNLLIGQVGVGRPNPRSLFDDQELIRTSARGYLLDLNGHWFDIDQFVTAVERCCGTDGEPQDPAEIAGCAQRALALWRGAPYADLLDVPWAVAESRRLTELRLAIIEARLGALLSLGRTAEVVAEIEVVSAQEPSRERLCELRMLALYRMGRQADALRTFQQYRQELAEATGLDPSAQMIALDRRIATSDPTLLPAPPTGRRLRAYRLIERIAEDAESETWRAVQPSLGHLVVIRQFRPEIANEPEFIRRFEAEAQAFGRLEHPYIVPLLDWWREPGAAFLVSRWMSGGTLSDRVRRGGASAAEIARIAVQIGGALTYAARCGWRHGALDARHVLADDDGNWLLGGFTVGIQGAGSRPGRGTVVDDGDRAAFAALLADTACPASADIDTPGAVRLASLLREVARSRASAGTVDPGGELTEQAGERANNGLAGVADIVRLVQREAGASTDLFPSAMPSPRNPYKGLRSFGEADAGDFFGRDRLVRQLLERCGSGNAHHRCLVVVGPSGSGKSSLVMAGLLPELRRGAVPGSDRWFPTLMTPGPNPFEALSAALARVAVTPGAERGLAPSESMELEGPSAEGELLLIVDQFEELFALCNDDRMRRRFLGALGRAASDGSSRVRIVLVMRADAWDRALRYPELVDVIGDAIVPVGALRADELEEAIVRPAEAAGCRLEPGLAARIVAEVGAQPGGLPMLQYALTELYERRNGELLTVSAYTAIGGVVGALARRADRLIHDAGPAYEMAAKRLLVRLVAVSPEGDEVRRRVELSQLPGRSLASEVPDALPLLLEARLLAMDRHPVTREPTIELAHEALLHAWPRLRTWLDDDVDSLRVHRHLGEAARIWEAGGRQLADLYRGSRLEDAVDWLAGHGAEANEIERAFVEASAAAREAELSRERARVRRLGRVLVVTAVALVLALVAGGLAVAQRHRANSNAQLAASRARDAQAEAARANAATRTADLNRLLAESHSLIGADRSLGLLLGLEADRLAPGADTQQGLADALLDDPRFLGRLPASQHVGTVFINDDTVVGIETTSGRVRRWRLTDHSLVNEGWAPSGEKGLFGSQQSTVDVAAGRVAFGGTTLVTVDDLRTGAAAGPAIPVPASFNGWTPVVLSQDGRVVYVGYGTGSSPGGGQGSVIAYDVASGQPTGVAFVGPTARIRKLLLSPDGRQLAAGSYDGTVRVWDTGDGHQFASFVAPALPIGLAWSPDGHRLAWSSTVPSPTTQATAVTSVRDVESGAEQLHLDGPAGPAFAVESFAPDGERIGVLDSAGTLSVYRLDGQAPGVNNGVARPESTFKIPAAGTSVVFGADGDTLVVAGEDTSLWSAGAALDIGRVVPGKTPSLPVTSIDGRLVGLGDDERVRLFDAQTLAPGGGALPRPDLPQQAQLAKPFAIRADSGQVAVGGGGGGVQLYDLPGGAASVRFADAAIKLTATLAYSPDGTRLAVGGGGAAAVFDTHTGQRIGRPVDLGGNSFALTTVGFTPSGLLVAAAWVARKAVVVDVETGTEKARFEQPFTASAVSADGRLLALGTTAGTVQLFDTTTLQPIAPPVPVFTSAVTNIAFSHDGGRLAALGEKSARLVDVRTASVVHSDFPAGAAGGGSFSADGRALLLPAREGGAVVWSIDAEVWRRRACELAGRNLTDVEWREHLPNGGARRPTCAQWPME